jgi:hypothetical protein
VFDHYYYAARVAEERQLAMASASLTIRAIHLELAARYEALVRANADRLYLSEPNEGQRRTG